MSEKVKKEFVLGFSMFCLFVLMLGFFIYKVEGLFVENIINNSIKNMTGVSIMLSNYTQNETLDEMAIAVANNHTYSNNYGKQYNCWDFSTDLKHELIKAGYDDITIMTGLYNPAGTGEFKELSKLASHTWIIVKVNGTTIHIETTPENIVVGIIPDDVYRLYYKEGYATTDKANPYKDEFLVIK